MPIRSPADVANDPAVGESLKRVPPLLYKYSRISGPHLEWMRKLIVESTLYFASPSTFNDPFDCRVTPRFDASELAVRQYWRNFVKRTFHGPIREHKPMIEKLVRRSKTNDGRAGLTEDLFKSLHEHGTACFGKNPASMLMWSYYAEGHRGIAVRFDMTIANLLALHAQGLFTPVEVRYETDFPNVNFFHGTTAQFIQRLLGTKSVAWKHEEEWRLVFLRKLGYVSLPPSMVSGVVLGMRIDPAAEAAVREWANQRSPKVELLRVANRANSFELEIVPASRSAKASI